MPGRHAEEPVPPTELHAHKRRHLSQDRGGREWRPQPLPYGTKPRLVVVHISSEAVRTRSREVEVGHSIRGFLETLGVGTSGGRTGPFAMFKTQMLALAACRMTIGMSAGGRVRTVDAKARATAPRSRAATAAR